MISLFANKYVEIYIKFWKNNLCQLSNYLWLGDKSAYLFLQINCMVKSGGISYMKHVTALVCRNVTLHRECVLWLNPLGSVTIYLKARILSVMKSLDLMENIFLTVSANRMVSYYLSTISRIFCFFCMRRVILLQWDNVLKLQYWVNFLIFWTDDFWTGSLIIFFTLQRSALG